MARKTKEQQKRSAAARKGWQTRAHNKRAAAARKGWETRKAKGESPKPAPPAKPAPIGQKRAPAFGEGSVKGGGGGGARTAPVRQYEYPEEFEAIDEYWGGDEFPEEDEY